jgi:hypothetical protein
MSAHTQPVKRSRVLPLFLLLCLLAACVIGGCVAITRLGVRAMHQSMKASLMVNPVIQEHIGTIQGIEPNYAEFDPEENVDYMVSGTKGAGRVRFKADSSEEPVKIVEGTLEMTDGKSWQLTSKKGDLE